MSPHGHNPQPQGSFSRRTFGRMLAGTLLFPTTLRATTTYALDEQPERTTFHRMLEATSDRPGADGDTYPVTTFASFDPETHGADVSTVSHSNIFPGGPASGSNEDAWEAFFGFPLWAIHALTVQDDATGFLMVIDGGFDSPALESIQEQWTRNGFRLVETDAYRSPGYHPYEREKSTTSPEPVVDPVAGHAQILANSNGRHIIVASDLELAELANRTQWPATDSMKFAPGAQAFLHHEPEAMFQSIILPGNRFAPARPAASDGHFAGLHGVMVATTFGHPFPTGIGEDVPADLRASWRIVASVKYVDGQSAADVYAELVEEQFSSAISNALGRPFRDTMSLDAVNDRSPSSVAFELTPLIDEPLDILDLAQSDDLGFLIPFAP